MADRVTGEQVRAAALAARIERVDRHRCSVCGYQTVYLVIGGNLFFDAGCWCPPHPRDPAMRSWDSAADLIEMQTDPIRRVEIAKRFGLDLDART